MFIVQVHRCPQPDRLQPVDERRRSHQEEALQVPPARPGVNVIKLFTAVIYDFS
jgi:hypothetical protein